MESYFSEALWQAVLFRRSTVLGPCIGSAVFATALGDFVIMTKNPNCYMFITPPQIIRAVVEEEITAFELGGWQNHSTRSGACHIVAEDDFEAIERIRELLSYLPLNNLEDPPIVETKDLPSRVTPEIYEVIPEDPMKPYDMREIIRSVLDEHNFLELQENFAPNAVIGFGRIDGRSVGIVANNPKNLAG